MMHGPTNIRCHMLFRPYAMILLQVKGTIEIIGNDLHEKNYVLVVGTRKETDSISLEVNAKSKSLVEEMHKHKHRKRVENRKARCLPIASHGNFRQLS